MITVWGVIASSDNPFTLVSVDRKKITFYLILLINDIMSKATWTFTGIN